MNIAEKIWYTWLVIAFVCFLLAWVLDDDYDTHRRAVNILLAIGFIPIGVGLIGVVLYALYSIWT